MARFTGINRWPRLFFCVTDWQDTIALLLGTASASITLDGSQFFGTADQAMSKMDQLAGYGGKGGPTFFDNMTKGALVFGAAIAGPMAMGVRGAISLEDAVVGVGASLGNIDGSTLEELSDLFLEVGANSKYSATEVAGVADELAKAGFDEVDLLGGMVEQVVMLSQATGEGLAPATAGITQAFSMWSEAVVGSELAMTDATRAADVLTIAANQSAGGITDVIGGLTNAGPALAGVGLGFDEAAAAIAYFTNFGYSGAEVGTKLSRTLTQLANPTAEAATLLNDLGISAFDLEGNFVGFPALFDQLQTGFAGMGDEARLAALKVIFGAEAFDLMNIATQTGGEGLLEFMGLFDQTGVAAEQSATRMGTVAAKFDALQEGIGSFFTSLVTGLLPGFHLGLDLANAFVDALMRIPDPIKTIIGAISGLLAIFATISIGASVFGALSTMLGGVGLTAGGAATALGAFVAPILAIGAAAVGLYAIWKTNFLGLGDVLDQAFAPVVRIGRTVTDAFQAGFKGVTSFVDRFASAFRKVEGPAKSAGKALDTVAGPLDGLRKGFSALVGVTNRVVKPIQAFANGFNALRGAAYDVLGPLTGIAGAGQRFADTLSAALSPLDKFGRMAQSTGDAVSTLGRVFDALAFAIGGINGGNIPPWLQDVADFFTEASDAADTFFQAFDAARNITLMDGGSAFDAFIAGIRNALGTIDVGAIAIRVGAWALTTAALLYDDLRAWVTGTLIPGAVDIGNQIISIGAIIWETSADIFGGFVLWASGLLAQTDWTAVQNTIRDQFMAAMSGAFAIGEAAGDVLGSGIEFASSIQAWAADQINAVDWEAVGSTFGELFVGGLKTTFAVGAGIAGLAGSLLGGVLNSLVEVEWGAVATTFRDLFLAQLNATTGFFTGFATVVGDELSTALGEVDWTSLASTLGTNLTSAISAVEGFAAGLATQLQSEISQALGEVDFVALAQTIGTNLGNAIGEVVGFAAGLAENLYTELTEMLNGVDWASVGETFGSKLGEYLIAGIKGIAGIVGFALTIQAELQRELGEALAGIDWASLATSIGGFLVSAISAAQGFAGGLGKGLYDEFSQALGEIDWSGIGGKIKDKFIEAVKGTGSAIWDAIWAEIMGGGEGTSTDIPPELYPDGPPGSTIPAPDYSSLTRGLTGGLEDAKQRVLDFTGVIATVGPAIQGAFGVSIDTSAFTGGLESAKASLVDLATTAQMQTLAMAMAGLQMGQAFVTGVQAGIGAGAGQVAGAITSLMAPASASRAQMALYGINAGLGYGTGVAAGIRSQTGAVAGAAASYLAVVSGYRGAMMAAGLGIGSALGQGIAAGIRSQIGAVAAAAASMVTTAVAAARAAGGIQSPSTVMRDQVGLNLALGTAEGILAGLPAIYSAANRMVYIPDVPNRGFAGGGSSSHIVTNNTPVTVSVNVEGNVTAEEDLAVSIAEVVLPAIAREQHRREVALGVN